jgi:hypothetical protein
LEIYYVAPLSLACPPIEESALEALTVTLYAPGVERVLGPATRLGFCFDPRAVRGFAQGALVVSSRDRRVTAAKVWLSAEERERLIAEGFPELPRSDVAYCTVPSGAISLGLVLRDPFPDRLEDEVVVLDVATSPFMGGDNKPRPTHIVPSRFSVFLFSERDGFLRYAGPPEICPLADSQTRQKEPREGPSESQGDDCEVEDPCDAPVCDCGGGFAGQTWIPVTLLNRAKVRFVVVGRQMAVAVFPGPQGWRAGDVYTVYLVEHLPEAQAQE